MKYIGNQITALLTIGLFLVFTVELVPNCAELCLSLFSEHCTKPCCQKPSDADSNMNCCSKPAPKVASTSQDRDYEQTQLKLSELHPTLTSFIHHVVLSPESHVSFSLLRTDTSPPNPQAQFRTLRI